MKAIVEYEVSGNNSGKITYYPQNNKISKKNLITSFLKEYTEQAKKNHSKWDTYDYYIMNVIKNYELSEKLTFNLTNKKEEYALMQEATNFYTVEDFDKIINEINTLYEDLISFLEKKTNTKYNKDYILQ